MFEFVSKLMPKYIAPRLNALRDSGAWLLVMLGLILFTLRVTFSPDGPLNLPAAFTVFQMAGLAFMVFGLQIMASIMMWPQFEVGKLYAMVVGERCLAAAALLMGLLIFNGLCFFGVIYWLAGAVGMGVLGK